MHPHRSIQPMRIRKRPPIVPLPSPSSSSSSSSLSQYSHPPSSSSSSSLQVHRQLQINGGRGENGTKSIDHGDLQVQVQPNPRPSNNTQVVTEDKGVGLDSSSFSSSPPKTLDAQLHNNGRSCAKSNSNGKKRRSPAAVLMEGSRCSRVNGRGWRCSQQTLIGYSLCEHHLGKGRIKSVTSVQGGTLSRTSRKSIQKNDLNLNDNAEAKGEDGRVAAAQVLA